MKNYESIMNAVKNCTIDSKPVQIIKDNPVSVGVTTTYVAGATVAKVAAGHTVGVALAHTLGVVAMTGALVYGGYKAFEYMEKKAENI